MTYKEQCEIEKLNKTILTNILNNYSKEDIISYYQTHSQQQTIEKFGLRNIKQLIKLLKKIDYDFAFKKSKKGKASGRSHENYVLAGKKSAETQRINWQNKSMEEKQAWAEMQKKAHNSNSFRQTISEINKLYRQNIDPNIEYDNNRQRSLTLKNNWAKLTANEKALIFANRFKNGCKYSVKDSIPNKNFSKLLETANLEYEREYCLDLKKFDFKIGNVLIEINPTFTHNSSFTPFKYGKPLDKYYHRDKSLLAQKYGFRCIHIFDWDNPKSIINLLKKRETVYARNCQVKIVTTKDACKFINEYHLQGYAKSTINLGLFHQGTLVGIMTFNKPRYNKNYDFELVRYCCSMNIIGGAEKLFKNFIKAYPNVSIISYCDLSKFSGKTYTKLGFKLLRTPTPSRHWVNYRSGEHYTDNLIRQQGFSRIVHKCLADNDIDIPTSNNVELMLLYNFVEVYDCGQATYVYKKEMEKGQ